MMRILKKSEVTKLFDTVSNPNALFLECYLDGKMPIYLKANTDDEPLENYGGGKTIGRVSKRIFKWYDWVVMDRPFMNVRRFRLKGSIQLGKQKKSE